MTAKLRIKAKGIEIEWEGEVDYLKNDLPDLIAAIVAALGISPGDDDDAEEGDAAAPLNPEMKFTTAALAAKVQPKTSADLFKVALAKLQLSDKIEPAERAQIHNEMKNAPKIYKPSMFKNLSQTIGQLLSAGEINEPATGKFALTPKAQQEVQAKL
jgi:hypothetical protein